MGIILFILASLFISFLAIVLILALEAISIKNGYRPDWEFIIGASLMSLIPFGNIILLFVFGGFLTKDLIKESGYLLKFENWIIKIIRGT